MFMKGGTLSSGPAQHQAETTVTSPPPPQTLEPHPPTTTSGTQVDKIGLSTRRTHHPSLLLPRRNLHVCVCE
jgi:hypothetical protein